MRKQKSKTIEHGTQQDEPALTSHEDATHAIEQKADFAIEESKMAVELAESARHKAEFVRDRAEAARNEAEHARDEAEFNRKTTETERKALNKEKNEAFKARDIAELALQEAITAKNKANIAEERYKLVIEGSDVGIWDWDIQKDTVYWSGRFFRMLGLTTTEIKADMTDTLLNQVHPEDKQRLVEAINEALKTKNHFEKQFRFQHTHGGYIVCSARGRTIIDEAGNPIRMAGTITDVTERIEMQSALEQAKKEAALANQRKTQALANMSHELKTPLNSIIGYSDMLLQGIGGNLTDKQEKFLNNIAFSGQHLLDMVNDILDITKIEAGKTELRMEQVALAPLVQEIQSMVQELAAQKQVSVSFDISQDVNVIQADPARIKQILINLLSNAIKFNRKGGRVQVSLQVTNDNQWLLCAVQDTGIGIPQEKIDHLFTEFYQIDTSTAGQQKGAGLGLALTKRLIELHGGSISVESEENVGSTFTVRLPVTQTRK